MDETTLRGLLAAVREGGTSVDAAVRRLKGAPFERLGDVATLDTHRTLRVGLPEVILAEAKTAAQVATIARQLARKGPLLVTRLAPEKAGPARRAVKGSVYDPVSRTLRRGRMEIPARGPVAVCCAGTSDIPVCEEAAVTLDVMGVEVIRVYDVGVAGLHRVLARREDLDRARAVIVAAGMEGALPSVVGRARRAAGHRGADVGGLRRLPRRPRAALHDAQLLRAQRHGRERRQRVRRGGRGGARGSRMRRFDCAAAPSPLRFGCTV